MRILICVEYNGFAFRGWQKQKQVISVQAKLEEAISFVANETIELFCAGRTDAGVHATNQFAHFDTNADRSLRAWTEGVSSLLPDSIVVKHAQIVPDSFHARFSAISRTYRYVIQNSKFKSAIFGSGLTSFYNHLNETDMHQACQALLGENDFTSFRAAHCQSKTPYRNVKHAVVSRSGDYVVIEIKANAFLYHMVRNIVGSLLLVGDGSRSVAWFTDLLQLKDRSAAAPTAKPNGLYLVDVSYPLEFAVKKTLKGPLFLSNQ